MKKWIENQHVLHISITDNPDIHGTIPNDIQIDHSYFKDEKHYNLQSLFAHNCDLSGIISSDLNFSKVNMITLHGNRLSGIIPKHVSISDFNLAYMLLTGKKFLYICEQ